MRPLLTARQGSLIRAIALYLSNDSGKGYLVPGEPTFVLEAMTTGEWSSLTFAGHRHALVMRPVGDGPALAAALVDAIIDLPNAIVAVEDAIWSDEACRLTAHILVIEDRRTA